jgi:hydrogenase nickel incorporation protein HypA/HybF
MHETALVSALLARVEREAEARGAQRVHRVEIALGRLAGVEGELFRSAWDMFRLTTCCADAELVIDAEEARWQCPRCGDETGPGGPLRCPTCNVPARLVAGGDVMLRRIEMEVRDV